MARKSKEQLLKEVHNRALTEFDRIQSAQRDERVQCLQDRRFYSIAGAQWEDKLGEQFENRPKFEMNKVHLAVIRIINEYRNNRISADFVPRDGSSNLDLADICDGLYRADEQDSGGEEAYDNAFEEGVGGGIGAWRLCNEYEDDEDEDNDHQRIVFEPIYDADTSVWFDLDAKRQDKSDAKRAYVIHSLSVKAYEDEWDDTPASWPKEVTDCEFDWAPDEKVFIAEYYEVEEVRELVRWFLKPAATEEIRIAGDSDEAEEEVAELIEAGAVETRRRKVKTRRVHKYILSGGRVLEDCGYIAGKHIPIVMFFGKRWYVDGIERCMGHVRLAKDAQRLKNMVVSWLAEIAGESPTSKPIFAPEQIAGHEATWRDDNIQRYPYLLANPLTDPEGNVISAGPQAYTKAPEIPPAMAALLQILDIDLSEILGNQQQGDKMVSNISGKAVEMIQERLDRQAFIYLSNFAKAMQRSAQIWLSMAKEIYTEKGRKLKMIGEMDNVETIELGREVLAEDGGVRDSTDLSTADFDVVSDVGPSFQSRRDATVRGLTNLMQFVDDPNDRKILSALILMNTEGEGLDEVNEFYRKQLVQMGVVEPNDEERKAMEEAAGQPQEPTPQDRFILASAAQAKADSLKKAAETDKIVAETAETEADTEKARAETLKTMSEIGVPPA